MVSPVSVDGAGLRRGEGVTYQGQLLALVAQSDGQRGGVCGRVHTLASERGGRVGGPRRAAVGAGRDSPGTPGKRFAEKTTKGSVKVWARTGDMSVCTPGARGSGAGGLWASKGQPRKLRARHPFVKRGGIALSRFTYAPTFMSRSRRRKVPAHHKWRSTGFDVEGATRTHMEP